MTKKLTLEEIEAKAASLTEEFKNKVTPIILTAADGSQVVGYCQEPEYDIMMYATDCYLKQQISLAAEATLKNTLIEKESDPRIISTDRRDGKIRASFTNAVMKLIIPYVDEYKKK